MSTAEQQRKISIDALPDACSADIDTVEDIKQTLTKIRAREDVLRVVAYPCEYKYFMIKVYRIKVLSEQDIESIYKLSNLIRDIEIYPRKHQIKITVYYHKRNKSSDVLALPFTFPKDTKTQYQKHTFANITHTEDQRVCENIIKDVHNVKDSIPDTMDYWVEPIRIPVHKKRVLVAFAICFVELPRFSCSFIKKLRQTYRVQIVNTLIRFPEPDSTIPTIFTIIVKTKDADVKQITQQIRSYDSKAREIYAGKRSQRSHDELLEKVHKRKKTYF